MKGFVKKDGVSGRYGNMGGMGIGESIKYMGIWQGVLVVLIDSTI